MDAAESGRNSGRALHGGPPDGRSRAQRRGPGKSFKGTTHSADGAERPSALVDRDFSASRPNELWVSDLTYVKIGRTFVYVAFVIDASARRIVGWQISSSLRSDLALDALEQAFGERLGDRDDTERLALAGIEPSVGSRGDSYDNALAETIIGLYKTELVYRHGPWARREDVELATLGYVWWVQQSQTTQAYRARATGGAVRTRLTAHTEAPRLTSTGLR